MIKAGDRISFYCGEVREWFNGTVIMLSPKNYLEHQKVDFYIQPDEPEKIKQFMENFGSIDDICRFKDLKHFGCIYNIEKYADSLVYMFWTKEGEQIKLLQPSINHTLEDGCKCKSCKHYIQYAAPNQPDNTFVCFSCVTNPIRAYY